MQNPRVPQGLTRLALFAIAIAAFLLVAWRLTPTSARLIIAVIAGFALLALLCVLVLPAQLVARDTTAGDLKPEQRASAVNSARTTLVQGMVGLAALAGIFVAWQQLQTDRAQQQREQLILTRQGQVADRFIRAVDQLASSKLDQRLGGIYVLERIAKESANDDVRLVVTELLRNYIYTHQNTARNVKAAPKPFPSPEGKGPALDLQAAMTVLGRRTIVATDPLLNLRGIVLPGVDLRGAHLQGADLSQADLRGAHLEGAQLQNARLNEAKLQGAFLDGAYLQQARLIQTQLQAASLTDAQMQKADLSGANLQTASLFGAQLQGANLHQTNLKGATVDDGIAWPQGYDWKKHGAEYP
jgi:Pentapeptide repeats (8 copies)